MSLRRSKCRESVLDRRPDLQLRHLPVEVARHNAFPEQREASHFGLDQTSSVVAAPSPPDRAAKATSGAEDFFRACAPGVVSSHGRAFLRAGMTARALCAAMAAWQARVHEHLSKVGFGVGCQRVFPLLAVFGVLEGVQLCGKVFFHCSGKGQAMALSGNQCSLGGFAFRYRVDALFDFGARVTRLVARL